MITWPVTFYYADSCNFNIQDDGRMGAHFNGYEGGCELITRVFSKE